LCLHCVSIVSPLCLHCVSIVSPLCLLCLIVSPCFLIMSPLCLHAIPIPLELSLSPEERKDVSARNGDAGLHDAQLRKAMLMVRLTQFSFGFFMGYAVAGVTRQCSDQLPIFQSSFGLSSSCLLLSFCSLLGSLPDP